MCVCGEDVRALKGDAANAGANLERHGATKHSSVPREGPRRRTGATVPWRLNDDDEDGGGGGGSGGNEDEYDDAKGKGGEKERERASATILRLLTQDGALEQLVHLSKWPKNTPLT
ncbi:unnamed protein product [Schistocephalus solidus]|uniref:Uncharacterized protein n=1 Tax=Schistocephalus solidus TaxID=70667 RepID=A0A183T2T8_SCHSO|nr:unnamed protein product [Schistocephalus solidus]